MMTVEIYQDEADFFHILSHPVRLQILDELRKCKSCVCHLQLVTDRPQAYVSQQLRVLKDAGLVVDEKDGQNVYYHLCDEKVRILLLEMLGPAEEPQHLPDCNCPLCTEARA